MYYKAATFTAFVLFIFNCLAQPTQDDIKRSRDFFNEGVKYGIDEKYSESLESFNKAIEINPIYAKAFLYRGLTKTELSDYKGAVRDYTITIELDPGYSDQAHYFRGIAKYKSGDYDGSIRDFSIAIRLSPDFISFFQRGKAYLKISEYGRALQDFDIANRLNPDYSKTFLYRGQTLYHVGQYKAAIDDLEQAKELFADNPTAFYYSGLARIAIQNSYVAIEDLDKCIELDPEFSEAYLARARAKKNTGNHQAAKADKKKAEALLAKTKDREETIDVPETTDKQKVSSETLNIADFFSSGRSNERTKPETIKDTEDTLEFDEIITESPAKKEKELTTETAATDKTITDKTKLDITQLSSGFYNNMLKKASPKGFGIQVASYSNTDNLQNLVSAYEEQYEKSVFINVSHINDQKIYRIIIGQFDDRSKAESFRNQLRQSHFSDCFLIVFERLY